MQQSLENKKEQKLKQVLKLNQKMQTSIKILGLSIEKLNEFIKQEIMPNKAVEVKFFSNQKNFYRDDNCLQIEELSQEKNFYEELEEQINFMKLDKKIKESCIFIINNLNVKGYLELPKVEMLKILNVSKFELDEAFKIIYKLEPYGLGAYSLEECLKLQLMVKNIQDKKLEKLIDKYLWLIAEKKLDLIKEKLLISDEELNRYIKEIKKLNPIPTRGFNVGKIRKIIPEVIVKEENGNLACYLNEEVIPKISIRSDENLDKTTYTQINNLIDAIERRYATLLKIAEFLVEEQKNFFELEGRKLKTLKIVDIAKKLKLNSSTVSRAIKEKYLLTPFGTIAFKKLICINSEVLYEKECIESYIENENRGNPYSDQELRDMLNKDGFSIARRTVSKYRKELGYKSSSQRKIKL